MMEPLVNEREEVASTTTPHLSHSRVSRYLHCPEQYRIYYVEGLRPRYPSASLVFGQVVHQALSFLFRNGEDPVKAFEDLWDSAKEIDLRYSKRESWETLRACGCALLEKFVKNELPRIGNVKASEQRFELGITGLDLPFVGMIDLVADLDGTLTVVDFKTSVSAYEDHEAVLSDQLTAYQLAEPEVEQTALCVLVKTKEPRIEWFVGTRSGADLLEYLETAKLVGDEIQAGHFYKRPGKWCSYCDYLPVCLKDGARIQETLVRV